MGAETLKEAQRTGQHYAQSCLTICDPMDCSLPGSSIHGIFPGKNTELVASCMLTLRVDDYWFLVFRFKIPNDS